MRGVKLFGWILAELWICAKDTLKKVTGVVAHEDQFVEVVLDETKFEPEERAKLYILPAFVVDHGGIHRRFG